VEELKVLIELLEATKLLSIGHAILLLIFGYVAGRVASNTIVKFFAKDMTVHGQQMLKRSVF